MYAKCKSLDVNLTTTLNRVAPSLALGPQLDGAQRVLEGGLVRHQPEDHPGAPVDKCLDFIPEVTPTYSQAVEKRTSLTIFWLLYS